MHADNEKILLEREGSEQDDLWGANWCPNEERIEFESLINIRPRLGNRSIIIQDQNLRDLVESITRELLGGIKVSSQNVGAYPCGRPVGQAQGAAPTPNY